MTLCVEKGRDCVIVGMVSLDKAPECTYWSVGGGWV